MANPQALSLAFAERLETIGLERATMSGVAMAVDAIVDTVGVTLAGAAEPVIETLSRTFGREPGPSLLFGLGRRTSVLDAALINGTASHAIDYDDMAHAMGGHPSVTLVPTVFALGEALGVSGRELLDAYIVGFEAECRLGRVVHPHHYGYWHPTSTLGVFGAAVAGARLLKLDPERTATAIALCGSLASGVKANFGTMTKPFHVGHCVRDGLTAALLARDGFTANLGALEHKQGFFAAYDGLENVDLEKLTDPWGDTLEVEQEDFGLKQFPCCGSTHPAILASLELRKANELEPSRIRSILIKAHPNRLAHTDNPNPHSNLGAKFSVQYAAVRALLSGVVRLEHFENDAFLDPEVSRLLAVTQTESAAPTGVAIRDQFAATVKLTLDDGRTLSAQIPGALGRGPANPMGADELWEKFQDCARPVLAGAAARQAFDLLTDLPQLESLAPLLDVLAQARPSPLRSPSRALEAVDL